MAALAVCAAAIPDRIRIKVKRHGNWYENARLWVALIGSPSTKKSPIIREAVRPIARLDARLMRKYLADKARYDEMSKEERKESSRPRQRRLRIEDTTIEAAQEVLKDSPDGVLLIQDELSGWFGAMDKYNSGGRGAAKDRAFWLQAFNGGQYSVHRIGRESALIDNLSVSMLGGIQPEAIAAIAKESVDDGLLQRLLPVVLQRATLGLDPVHFGVILCFNLLLGMMTPPMGVGLYVMSNVGKVPVGAILRATIPFFIPLLVALGLITFVPELSLWLPRLVFGS
jgi:hypothetical protein